MLSAQTISLQNVKQRSTTEQSVCSAARWTPTPRRRRCKRSEHRLGLCQAKRPVTGTYTPAQRDAALKQNRQMDSGNFPTDEDGRTYHVGTKRGDVAQRILGVGSLGRAKMLGTLLKPLAGQDRVRSVESSRGFLTITGQWKGHPVSIITHLMGFGNMDLFLRETRAVVDSPMLVIRIGTCGSLNSDVGQIHVPTGGSVAVLRNPDAFLSSSVNGAAEPPYRITQPCHPDSVLTEALVREMKALLGAEGVVEGMNASADSFFSSQGRSDPNFEDRNDDVLDLLLSQQPDVTSLEMESFHLFHLAYCSRGGVRAAAGALSLANRTQDSWIDVEKVNELEFLAGEAALNALVSTPLAHEQFLSIDSSSEVWAD